MANGKPLLFVITVPVSRVPCFFKVPWQVLEMCKTSQVLEMCKTSVTVEGMAFITHWLC